MATADRFCKTLSRLLITYLQGDQKKLMKDGLCGILKFILRAKRSQIKQLKWQERRRWSIDLSSAAHIIQILGSCQTLFLRLS